MLDWGFVMRFGYARLPKLFGTFSGQTYAFYLVITAVKTQSLLRRTLPDLPERNGNTSSTSSDLERQKDDDEPPIIFWWKIIVMASCLIAVVTDPLFLYIPFMNGERKCLRMDKRLRTVALIFRSVTDVIFIIDIVRQVHERMKAREGATGSTGKNKKKQAKKEKWRFRVSMMIHILSLLPLPQIALLVIFVRSSDSKFQRATKALNIFLLLQYVPNILRVRHAYKELHLVEKFVGGTFNFILYIVASHVIGAFWYYFSVEREISCWLEACKSIAGCIIALCGGDNTPANDTFLDRSCPVNPSNATIFDFGMFLDTIQSGYARQRTSPSKVFYYFWWGLKNLSNFGTNLQTSSYIWENCFAILISITGLLLFLYLIGNVQTYIQFSKSREIKQEEQSTKMMEKEYLIRQYVEQITCLSTIDKSDIMKNIRPDALKTKLTSDVDMCLLLSIVLINTEKNVKKIVGKHAIKKVKELQDMDVDVLENMCEYLVPMSYLDGYEFKKNSSIDQVLFITRGELVRTGNHPNQTDLDCYGSELLWWASPSISCPNLKVPNLDGCVRCQGEVEAFSLTANDLKSVVMKFRQKWNWCMYSCEIESPPISDLACPLEMTDDIYEEYIKTWKDKLIKQQRTNLSNDIETWLASTCLGDEDVKQKIKEHMLKIDIEKKKEIKKEMGALGDLGTIFPLLSQDIQSNLAKNALKRVDYFKRKPDSMLEPVSKCLKPKIFKENSYVAKSAEKRDFILFVVKGFMGCTNLSIDAAMTSGYIPKLYVMKDTVYGEHLLSWASTSSNTIDNLPFSTQEFKCFEKVEAFILKVSELKVVASKFDKWAQLSPAPNHENKTSLQIMNEVHKQLNDTAWKGFDNDDFKKLMKFICKEKEIHDWLLKRKVSVPLKTQVTKIIKDNKVVEKQEDEPVDLKYMFSINLDWTIEEDLVDQLCMPIFNKVALLKPMPAILKSMRDSLEPMVYQSNDLIVEKGKSLELILLIINGEITLADNDSIDNTFVASRTRSKSSKTGKRIYFAEELLKWFSFENERAGSDPPSPYNVRCQTKVEAFILPISKLRCVLSDNISEWESNWKTINKHIRFKKTDSNEIGGEKSEQQQREIKIKDEIHDWLLRHGFNEIFEKKFWFHVRINKSIEKNIDAEVDLEYILSSLKLPPTDIVKPMIEHLCIVTLKKVPMLKKMPDEILEKMCLHMEAKVYKEKEQLVGKGELLEFVFVIVDGEVEWTVETKQKTKTRGDFFGERLLNWASPRTMFSSPVPTATKDIRCLKKVEVFRLSIKNLESLVFEHIDEWKSNFQLRDASHLNSEINEKYKEFQRGAIKLSEIDSIEDKEVRKGVKIKINILKWMSSNGLGEDLTKLVMLEIEKRTAIEHAIDGNATLGSMLSITGADGQITKFITQGLCIRWLRKVSMLEHLHEDVLKAMSDHVEAVYLKKNQPIVNKGEILPFVLIIVEGEIELSNNTSEVEATDSKIITKGKGDVFGEELFNWASPHVMFIGSAPTSTVDVKCQNKLQAFKLTVENLRQVVYEHKPHWDLNFKSSTNQQLLEDATAMRNNIDKIYKQWQEGSIKLEEIVNEEYREAIKIKIKENDIDKWMSDNGFSEELKELAKLEIQKKNAIRSDMDTDIGDMYLKFMLSLAGSRAKITTDIAHHFCSGTLKKVPKLKRLDENVFRKISDQVKGFYLDVDNFVVKKGEPLPFVLIIVEGVIEWSEMAGGVETIVTKKKGDIYGEELLDWVSPGADTSMPSKDRPTSNVDVICREKVQGFKLTPGKLGRVVNDCETEWRLNFGIKDPISLEFIADQILKRRVEPIQKKQKTTNSRGKGGEREGTFRRSGKRKVVEQV